ncbi:MAG: hypothetical protein ABGX10_09655 [Paracoccus sp. (in: a-proteobacteria)]
MRRLMFVIPWQHSALRAGLQFAGREKAGSATEYPAALVGTRVTPILPAHQEEARHVRI